MITYHMDINPKQDDSAFYCWSNGQTLIATATGDTKKLNVVANGEMYLAIPVFEDGKLSDLGENVIRYSDQLEDAGIRTDFELNQFSKTITNAGWQVWHMNNWFEVYGEEDEDGVVFDSLKRALEFAEGETK